MNKAATATALVSSLNPSTVGNTVTFTATVSAATATGTVQLTVDGGSTVVPVVAGQASLSRSGLGIGAHVVVATYGGDAAFATSISPTLIQSVGSALRATTTVVTSNRVPSAKLKQTITFTASVRPAAGAGHCHRHLQFTFDGVNTGGLLTLNAQGRATYSTRPCRLEATT